MQTPDKQMFLDMQEHPEKYSEQQIEALLDELDRVPDMESAWQKFSDEQNKRTKPAQNHASFFTFNSSLQKVAAMFIGVILLSGIAYAAVHGFTKNKEAEQTPNEQKEPEKKMLMPFFVPVDASEWHKKHLSDAICVYWSRGAWIQKGSDSFVEEHPVCKMGWMFRVDNTTVRLDGRKLDIHHLPDMPAAALKKMEVICENENCQVNIITTPVQIPADVKGNINPELTILLTGTPPRENTIKSSIYYKEGIHASFDWKLYQYSSWTSTIENIGMQLEEVAIRKDHHVRVNVCRGVPQKHIERIKKLMCDNGVTNYELINQE